MKTFFEDGHDFFNNFAISQFHVEKQFPLVNCATMEELVLSIQKLPDKDAIQTLQNQR